MGRVLCVTTYRLMSVEYLHVFVEDCLTLKYVALLSGVSFRVWDVSVCVCVRVCVSFLSG